ncbi:hypothetical protein EZV62_011793 [Acer yangbiense]|uniref:Dirigent protein n=1 Tax=Acer yangbiense TaxID=1000413 RepID=A0A5C7I7P6_9ROSI|nr:hypothetical protein EZV62_011793 [Acer yangbiense]
MWRGPRHKHVYRLWCGPRSIPVRSTSQAELDLIMVFNFGFTEGMYKDNSISILGLNSAMNPIQEMSIVGGTGIFRLARGYVIAQTHWFEPAFGDAIVGYNVTIVH